MLIFDQCCQMCSSTFNSASLVEKKVSYKEVASFEAEKKKKNKQAGKCLKDTASKGADSANTINCGVCLHKSIHI